MLGRTKEREQNHRVIFSVILVEVELMDWDFSFHVECDECLFHTGSLAQREEEEGRQYEGDSDFSSVIFG